MKILKNLVILCLVVSTNAYADFRKALDFLQKTQGTEMLVEVEDAVKTKNNNGLSIFLGTLSSKLSGDEFFISTVTGDNAYIGSGEIEKRLLLGKNNIPELMMLLETAASSADIETQFDFALLKSRLSNKENQINVTNEELERFAKNGVKRAENILYRRNNKNFYINKTPNLQAELEAIKKHAELGNLESAARLAIVYLRWLPYEQHPDKVFFNAIPQNESEGFYWLKRYASNTSQDSASACKLADEYYVGDKIKKDNQQAYLWYMHSAFNIWGINDCTFDGLRNMAFTGDLESIDPKLSALAKEEHNDIHNIELSRYIMSFSGKLDLPKDIKQFKAPENPDLLYAIKETRYRLAVFKSGEVKYEGFNPSPNNDYKRGARINSYLIGRDEWKVSNIQIQQFTKMLNELDVASAPNAISESVLCDTGEIWREGSIYINTKKYKKTIDYTTIRHVFYTPLLAKLFKVQESNIPTQHLRCGAARQDNAYKNCVVADDWNFKHADESK